MTTTTTHLVRYLLLACLCAPGCQQDNPRTLFSGRAMGTNYSITMVASSADRPQIHAQVKALLEAIDRAASQWRADSWVSGFNQKAATRWDPVPEHAWPMLLAAADLHRDSRGAFDITAGPLVELWGFGARPAASPPSDRRVAETLRRCGMQKLELDRKRRAVRKTTPGIQLDFSALAKGYAVDRIAGLLDEHGIEHYLIEFGGEVRAKGHRPGGEGWVVQLADEKNRTITLHNSSAATSGGAGQYRAITAGPAATHLIDPRSGRPMTDPSRSVTVCADNCMLADAWATALAVDPTLALPPGVALRN